MLRAIYKTQVYHTLADVLLLLVEKPIYSFLSENISLIFVRLTILGAGCFMCRLAALPSGDIHSPSHHFQMCFITALPRSICYWLLTPPPHLIALLLYSIFSSVYQPSKLSLSLNVLCVFYGPPPSLSYTSSMWDLSGMLTRRMLHSLAGGLCYFHTLHSIHRWSLKDLAFWTLFGKKDCWNFGRVLREGFQKYITRHPMNQWASKAILRLEVMSVQSKEIRHLTCSARTQGQLSGRHSARQLTGPLCRGRLVDWWKPHRFYTGEMPEANTCCVFQVSMKRRETG